MDMQNNTPLVSAIILTYNEKKFKEKFLDSLKTQSYPNIEVIMIDNGSGDDSLEQIKQWLNANDNKPGITYRIIANNLNAGFAAGQNQGIRESKGKYVLCLNQDAWLHEDFIRNAVEIMERNKEVAAIQGKLIRYDFQKDIISDIIDTTGLVMLKNRRIINRSQGEPASMNAENKIEEVFGPDGAAPVYRRQALENIKLPSGQEYEYFDEDFFIYKEDVDLAWRLRLYGWKAVYIPQCVGYHGRGAGDSAASNYSDILKERRNISPMAKYYSWKNQRLMQIKNETGILFLKHLFYILPKEIASWAYILLFEEPMAIKSIWQMLKQSPAALRKRKIIMANKKISNNQMEKWFL